MSVCVECIPVDRKERQGKEGKGEEKSDGWVFTCDDDDDMDMYMLYDMMKYIDRVKKVESRKNKIDQSIH